LYPEVALVYIAAIDASKAFDQVNHNVLFRKLVKRGAPSCFVGVLMNWYNKLESSVRWNGVLSSSFRVLCGVCQGGILSPLLFNVYVDELIESLSASGCRCHIGRMFYGCIMYADDLLLLSPTLTGLQSMFHVCDSYAEDHNLVFNVKKTCCAVIGKHRSVIRRLVLAEQAVPWTDRLRYLGVSFTCSNTLDVDVSPVRRNFYAACNSIIARSRGTSEPVRVQGPDFRKILGRS